MIPGNDLSLLMRRRPCLIADPSGAADCATWYKTRTPVERCAHDKIRRPGDFQI